MSEIQIAFDIVILILLTMIYLGIKFNNRKIKDVDYVYFIHLSSSHGSQHTTECRINTKINDISVLRELEKEFKQEYELDYEVYVENFILLREVPRYDN